MKKPRKKLSLFRRMIIAIYIKLSPNSNGLVLTNKNKQDGKG
jgi:hypothetical protein